MKVVNCEEKEGLLVKLFEMKALFKQEVYFWQIIS